MKVWNSYGSEHSANLVMIGKFKDVASAEDAETAFDEFTEFARDNGDELHGSDRFPEEAFPLLRKHNVMSLAAFEMEQFRYDISWRREGDQIIITTDEVDVSALMKIMIDKGARVEIYSAHDYPDTGKGR